MRYKELDLARGFTVMFMPAVHVTMLYGNNAVYGSWLGASLNWVAVFPGAQLFMMLMGISFNLSAQKERTVQFQKSMKWLLTGYMLNFFKFVVPAIAGWLPGAFFQLLHLLPGAGTDIRMLLVGDILQLAALSLLIVTFIHRFSGSKQVAAYICIFIIMLSPVVWRLHTANTAVNETISLVTGNDPLVYFPLFPWLVYPLTGYLLGRQYYHIRQNFLWLAIAGILLMLPDMIATRTLMPEGNLYRSLPLETMYHLGFCFIWLPLCAVVQTKIKTTSIMVFLSWCSRHITIIYLTQWILIFWCMRLLPFRGLTIAGSLIYSIGLSLLVFGLSMLMVNYQKWKTLFQGINPFTKSQESV